MSAERDGRRTSKALTAARTVLGNVDRALADYGKWGQLGDPAGDEIERALETCQKALEPFRRTGTTKRE